jgi:hypothetical protein
VLGPGAQASGAGAKNHGAHAVSGALAATSAVALAVVAGLGSGVALGRAVALGAARVPVAVLAGAVVSVALVVGSGVRVASTGPAAVSAIVPVALGRGALGVARPASRVAVVAGVTSAACVTALGLGVAPLSIDT